MGKGRGSRGAARARRGLSGKGNGHGQPSPPSHPAPAQTSTDKRGWFLACPCIPKGSAKPQNSIWWSQCYKGMLEKCKLCGAKWQTVADRQGYLLPTVQRQPLPGQIAQDSSTAQAPKSNAKLPTGADGNSTRPVTLMDFLRGIPLPTPASPPAPVVPLPPNGTIIAPPPPPGAAEFPPLPTQSKPATEIDMFSELLQQFAGEGCSQWEAMAKASAAMPARLEAQKSQAPPQPNQRAPPVLVPLTQFNQMGTNVAYLEKTVVEKRKAMEAKEHELKQATRNYEDVLKKLADARVDYEFQVQLRAEAARPAEPAGPPAPNSDQANASSHPI